MFHLKCWIKKVRYLIDTNIFIYLVKDYNQLSKDVRTILEDYNNTFCISSESVKELIVGFNRGKLVSKYWASAYDMVDAIRHEYYIDILPVGEEQMKTYSKLRINRADDHNDPSDHVIISHAITNRMPLISSDSKFPFYRDQGLDLVYNG